MREGLIRRSDVLKKTAWLETDVPTRAAPLRTEIVLADDVRSIPAVDAVEVVRCRDCKYCQIADPYEAWCYGGLPAQLTRLDEDFCSRGKRREDGDA